MYADGQHKFCLKKEHLFHFFWRREYIVQLHFLYRSGEVLHRAFHSGVTMNLSEGYTGIFGCQKMVVSEAQTSQVFVEYR